MLNLELSIAKGMMLTEKFKTIKNDYIIPWKKQVLDEVYN